MHNHQSTPIREYKGKRYCNAYIRERTHRIGKEFPKINKRQSPQKLAKILNKSLQKGYLKI